MTSVNGERVNKIAADFNASQSAYKSSCASSRPKIDGAGPWRFLIEIVIPLSRNGDTETEWHLVMATTLLAILRPVAVVLLMQRWFVRGLIEPEK